MQSQDAGLKAAIKNASALVQETASKSEAAALDAVVRLEQAVATAQDKWAQARELGGEVAQSLGHAGRTSINGVAEFNGTLGTFGKDALTDAIEFGRKAIKARSINELLDLHLDFIARRSQAMFTAVSELNAVAQAKTVAAWAPFGEAVRKVADKSVTKAAA